MKIFTSFRPFQPSRPFALVAALLLTITTAQAQRVITNTVNPVDFTQYDGKTVDLSIFRYIHQGWNTICLPIDLTTDEVNTIFGNDCTLETLVGVENTGTTTRLNFKDVKPDGLKANTPYLLHSTQPSGVVEIAQSYAYVTTGPVELKFTDNTGTEVVFGGATEAGDALGIYGILVRDNSEAKFVDASNVANGILASRCFIRLNEGETQQTLYSNHLDYNMTSADALQSELTANEPIDVYNISGVIVAKSISPSEIHTLPKGAYVTKGKAFLIE